MERKLFIIRHGKSSWESVVNDIDRPLTERGVRNNYAMAHKLKDDMVVPEAVYTSPATRAFNTAIIMSQIWELKDHNIFVRNKLYLPEVDDIYSVVYEIPNDFSSVAIFGHNPGFTHFVNEFLKDQIDNLPTSGVVVLSLKLNSWTDLGSAEVVDTIFNYPKRFV
ncbi:MAG TPA: histidine phosphatase family protein [Bacteroidales bacterium]|nr:histidine phosphatase family protein [Bacteroidales bacterium]